MAAKISMPMKPAASGPIERRKRDDDADRKRGDAPASAQMKAAPNRIAARTLGFRLGARRSP